MPDFCIKRSASPPAPTNTNFVLIVDVAPVRLLRTVTVQVPSDSRRKVAHLVAEQRLGAVLHAVADQLLR